MKSSDIHITAISQEMPQPSIAKICLKIKCLKFHSNFTGANELTHWGWVTHICVGKLTIIGSDNGLSPDRRQAIIWTNAGLLSIGPLQTYFSENLIKIQQFSMKKMHMKMSSAKWRSLCLGLNVLTETKCNHSSHFYNFHAVNDSLFQCWQLINPHPNDPSK